MSASRVAGNLSKQIKLHQNEYRRLIKRTFRPLLCSVKRKVHEIRAFYPGRRNGPQIQKNFPLASSADVGKVSSRVYFLSDEGSVR